MQKDVNKTHFRQTPWLQHVSKKLNSMLKPWLIPMPKHQIHKVFYPSFKKITYAQRGEAAYS